MAARCMLSGRILVAMARLGKLSNYTEVNVPLNALLINVWLGFLQSIMNERANQSLRDEEERGSTKKDITRLKRWEVVRRSGLLEGYGANVVEVDPALPVPTDVDLKTIFRAVGDADSVDLKRITKEQDCSCVTDVCVGGCPC